jgi:PAS domain S-box-containing protein
MTVKEKYIVHHDSLVNDSFNEIYTFDAVSYKFTYLNSSALNNLGYSMEEMLKLTPIDIKPDYDINSFENLVLPLKNKQKPKIQFYTNHQRKDGTLYPVEVHLQLSSKGKSPCFSAFIIDITEKRKLEINLLESYNIINSSPITVFRWEGKKKWNTSFVSENVINLLGYTAKEFLENKISYKDVIHPEDFNRIDKELFDYYKSKQKKKLVQEYRVITKDSSIKWVRDFPLIHQVKNKTTFNAVLQDITENINIKKVLINSEKKFKDLFEKSNDALLIIKNNIFIDCNIATSKMLGYSSKKEFLNVHPSKLSPKTQPDGKDSYIKAEEKMSIALKKGSHRFEWMHTKKSGKEFPVEVLLTTIYNEENNKVIYCVWRDITKRKQSENELKESQKKFKKLYNNSPDMFLSVSAKDASILQCNDTLIKKTGYSRKEIIGTPVFNMYQEDSIEKVKKAFKQFTTKGNVKNVELNLKKKNGDILIILLNAKAVKDETGNILHSISSWTDITERKIIENKLTESEEENRLIIESSPLCIHQINLQDQIITINPAGVKMMCINSDKEIIGTNYLDAVANSHKDRIHKLIQKAKKGEDVFTEFISRDQRIFSTSFIPIFNKEKAVIRLMGITQDITERKKTENELIKSESNLLQSQKVANLGSYVLDIKNMSWTSSKILDDIFGINKSFFRNINGWINIVHPEDREDMMLYFENNILKKHEKFDKQYRIVKINNKKECWVHGLGELEFDDNGNPIKMLGTIQDITKYKKNELELFEKNQLLEKHISNTPLAHIYFDLNCNVKSWNLAAEKIFGYTATEAIGKNIIDLVTPERERNKLISQSKDKSINGRVMPFSTNENITKQGNTIICNWYNTILNDQNNDPIGSASLIEDITYHKEKEVILLENENRLSSIYNTVDDIIFYLDIVSEGVYKFNSVNKSFCNVTGLSKDQIIGKLISEVIPEPSLSLVLEKYQQAITEKSLVKWEETSNYPNGVLTGIISVSPIFDSQGQCINIVGSVHDITEKKKIEAELEKYRKQLEDENVFLKEEIALSFNYEDMVYSSLEISEVLTQVEQVAATDATVLVLGETGTGKELIAKAIHNTSDRKHNPLIRVNCAAIPTELIESELFGHIKGSFTGALQNRIGKFELAHGGTLFLDEIGELPFALQPKLLRAIQEGEIEPIGCSKIKKLYVRIIAATNRDLKKEVEEKRFREDLYFRLNVFPITVPPLRKRIEDIPVLIDHFVNKYCKKHNKDIKYISDATLQKMKSYEWPGNVRELENLIERAVIISNKDLLNIKEFETSSTSQKATTIKHGNTALEEVQRNHIIKILNKTNWKIDGKQGAAILLDIKPSTLRDRMKKFGIKRPKQK